MGHAQIVGSDGCMVLGHRHTIRAGVEFEGRQLAAGIWRCGGGWSPQTRLYREEREGWRAGQCATTRCRGAEGGIGGKKDPRNG